MQTGDTDFVKSQKCAVVSQRVNQLSAFRLARRFIGMVKDARATDGVVCRLQRGGIAPMKCKLAVSCFALCTITAGLLLPAEQAILRPEQVSSAERVNFAPGGTIRLDNSFGDLYVEGWDQPEVEMTLIKLLQDYEAPKNANELLERVKFTTQHPSATELVIGTTIPSHSFFRHPFGGKGPVDVRYELRVPRDSHLVIHHGGGNILIGDVTGDIEATNREGDIVLMLPASAAYSVDAKSKMGTVISDFAGKAHVRYFIGERFAGADANSPHKIFLRVRFGGITIKEVPTEASPDGTTTK